MPTDFTYPEELSTSNEPFILFTSYKSVTAIRASKNPVSSIALYVPPSALKTSITQKYGEVENGALMAAANAGSRSDVLSRGLAVFESVATGLVKSGAKATLDLTKGAITASSGMVINNHTAMLYQGPGDFRTHDFTFTFIPRNTTEGNTIQKIIADFEKGAKADVPTTPIASSAFFMSPRHYKIEIFNNKNEIIYDTKNSVITSFLVNYDPLSTPSFHEDGSPVATKLTLQFKELELASINSKIKQTINPHQE